MNNKLNSLQNGNAINGVGAFRATWQRAIKLEQAGQTRRARRAWEKALRHSMKLGSPRFIKLALSGLEGKFGPARLGPSTTPRIAKRPRSGRADRLRLRTPEGNVTMNRNKVEGFVRASRCSLLIDRVRQQVRVGAHILGMEGREIPLNILACLAQNAGGPVPMARMFQMAWGRKFNAAFDANTVYFHVCRLRKMLDEVAEGQEILVKTSEGYQLKPGLRFGLVELAETPKIQRGHNNLIDLIKQQGFITNRTYCEVTKTSRSTALRELADLVEKGVLVRCGSGRGAHYRLAEAEQAA